MKFAKVFQQLLDEEDLPQEWVAAAIQYKALKKCINKVVTELEDLGLEKDTLQLLLAYEKAQRDASGAAKPKLVYSFEGTATEFVPKITILLNRESGLPLDAHISPDTRARLERLVQRARQKAASNVDARSVTSDESDGSSEDNIYISEDSDVLPNLSSDCLTPVIDNDSLTAIEGVASTRTSFSSEHRCSRDFHSIISPDRSPSLSPSDTDRLVAPVSASTPDLTPSSTATGSEISAASIGTFPEKIEIHLHSDSEFFHMLTSELAALDSLQQEQTKNMTEQVHDLARKLPHVASPLNKKNDLYVWREIFRLYLDAGVFFSSLEQDHGDRSVDRAKEQLLWFTNQVKAMNLEKRFKMKESKEIFEGFWKLNISILQSLQFQNLNQTATTKILKKFDKQTALTTRDVFPSFYFNQTSTGESTSIARSVCFTMAETLMSVIPQLDDYVCPVCYLIAYRPIRLNCGHVFCIRCLIKLQRQVKDECPICRQHVVLEADGYNVDYALQNQMKLYFPKEVKLKLAAAQKEIVQEQFHLGEQKEIRCVIQ
ncbi:SPX domain-containing protein [Myxozyma melibiosi]|uniref:SPX domain-containing protein n=1 Tax=Myxozyma melibiosi TaxID=54550 RepID=A0ABR1EXU3_9ASCO